MRHNFVVGHFFRKKISEFFQGFDYSIDECSWNNLAIVELKLLKDI